MKTGQNNNILFVVFYTIIIILIKTTIADTDFMSNCGKCKCKWNSGKKFADCSNITIVNVPKYLSTELQVLDLSYNSIAELHREEFIDINLLNLHKLFMKNCTIQEINEYALSGLAILIELDLSNNMIKILKPGTFNGLIKLRTINLNNNDIEILEDKLFNDLPSINKIEITNNKLYKIGINVFVNVPKLLQINIDSNKLTILRKETFQNIEKLSSLALSLNPWNCTCELRLFREYVIDKNLYTPPTICEYPKELHGKLWPDVNSDNFACKPNIIMPRVGTSIDAHSENVTLKCEIKGWPLPTISWAYNKRPLNLLDQRFIITNNITDRTSKESTEIINSELTIIGVKTYDKGAYTCIAVNNGGRDETDILLAVPIGVGIVKGSAAEIEETSDILYYIIGAVILFLVLLLIIILLYCCCRRNKKYKKNGSISENGLVAPKIDKSQNDSMLEGGSVIMEMQKSLLTEVNLVPKPPRRSVIESNGHNDLMDGSDVKRTLLDETSFGNNDEETQSIALSDTIPRSRQAFVDDGYGNSLPPDLLTFPSRFPQSPSLQSSLSNIQDGRLYGKSPLSSPVYQQSPGIYQGQMIPGSFRTLQHPKTGRPLAVVANRSNSPFTPGPIIYPLIKQGYVTIPRKQRIPSWTPSINSTMSEFPPTSPTSISSELLEPVYDNLGLRTTLGGNSTLNINKLGIAQPQPTKMSMRDRPLPATPIMNGLPKAYEPIQETSPTLVPNGQPTDTESLYGRSGATPVINAAGEKASKLPPRPPPKPKKRISMTSAGGGSVSGAPGSTSQLFEDEGEDGTEV